MADQQLVYEGSSKKLLNAENENFYILEFKDSEANFDGEKKSKFKSKSKLRVQLSNYVFEYLEGYNIPTHWSELISETQVKVKKMDMLPIRVIIRNVAAGTLCERFSLIPGTPLKYPVIEYYLKDKDLGNPLISESHAYAFEYATPEEMKHISRLSSKVNAVLKAFFERRNLKLVDYQLEFGRYQNQIHLGDEITPDNARLWHMEDDGTLKPNHFRFANNSAEKSFREILARLTGK